MSDRKHESDDMNNSPLNPFNNHNTTSNDTIDIDELIKELSGDNLNADPVLIDLDDFLKDIEKSNNDGFWIIS